MQVIVTGPATAAPSPVPNVGAGTGVVTGEGDRYRYCSRFKHQQEGPVSPPLKFPAQGPKAPQSYLKRGALLANGRFGSTGVQRECPRAANQWKTLSNAPQTLENVSSNHSWPAPPLPEPSWDFLWLSELSRNAPDAIRNPLRAPLEPSH